MSQNVLHKESGAVSLFVVIFAMLIITVVTVSFLRLTINDQLQSSDSDLSQSAYDSALAGVEDAKRALLRYQQVCSTTPTQCGALNDVVSTDVCNAGLVNVVPSIVEGTPPGEVPVQQSTSTGDTLLNQAYTCVKMQLSTEDYVGNLSPNQSQVVPLIGDPEGPFGGVYDTVTVRWFNRDDMSTSSGDVDLENVASDAKLPETDRWPSSRPPIMRAQLIQFGSNFTLEEFDTTSGAESNTGTVFLYPSSATGARTEGPLMNFDFRKDNPAGNPVADPSSSTPLPVRCASIAGGGYSCSMSLTLPNPVRGGDRTAFLRLTPLYNSSHFVVVLSNGVPNSTSTNIVYFKDVQPKIDSTGRANDLFRRVVSRVDLFDTSFPYPDATIDVTNNFCKDFGVTDTEYISGSCAP
jgi:Tfp pilus assembly protein PilX